VKSTPKPTPKTSPKPAASPKASPKASVSPKPSPAASASPKAASPAAGASPKVSGSPSSKASASPDVKSPKAAAVGSGQASGGSVGRSGGGGDSSKFGWYHELIHDRFYSQWDQPTSIFDSSKSFVCTLQIRIEHDGKISDVKVVRSSGNVVMDESVMAAAHRVLQIDPLPAGLGGGGAYTVNINFELQ
jgi:TonB family protein